MAIKVGINGFGRIGRMVTRVLMQHKGIEIVHINDLADAESLAHLFKYDSVHGIFDGSVKALKKGIKINGKTISISNEKEIARLPWKEKKVDVVIESTGIFRYKEQLQEHLDAGAKKAILTVPPKDGLDRTVVLGVNCKGLKKSHKLVSNASCTTNCLSPLVHVLEKEFGVKKAGMTTIHSYTADQRLVDGPHSDLRRARAAGLNMVPTTTGAAKATGKVVESISGKIDGLAIRVPTPSGSLTDLTAITKKKVSIEQVNAAFEKAAKTYLKGILKYSEEPLVSSDIVGDSHSAIVDGLSTMVIDGDLVKVLAWYDNEYGYASRVAELIKRL